ncbi:hypothetical protein M378DRAFT_18135 [Amanita muscaria Koide BX008]|uniref:Uncharacterized protein n=1 Tax=Amanita muscaria (strain Koide BX008) TaxID=946122 RepID=A0A0C2W2A4_AMAMK|nr:hypothetical protein M378DRAFT_18135 [Amanita muscaria Koide BX008]
MPFEAVFGMKPGLKAVSEWGESVTIHSDSRAEEGRWTGVDKKRRDSEVLSASQNEGERDAVCVSKANSPVLAPSTSSPSPVHAPETPQPPIHDDPRIKDLIQHDADASEEYGDIPGHGHDAPITMIDVFIAPGDERAKSTTLEGERRSISAGRAKSQALALATKTREVKALGARSFAVEKHGHDMPTCRSAVDEESVTVKEESLWRLTWTPRVILPCTKGRLSPVLDVESEAEAPVAVTTLSKVSNIESLGNMPFSDSDLLAVVSAGKNMLGVKTRQKIISDDVTSKILTSYVKRRIKKPPDIDSLNLELSRAILEATNELEVETRQKVIKKDVLSRKLTLCGGRHVWKPPDAIVQNLEQSSKEDAIGTVSTKLRDEEKLELTCPCPQYSLVIKNAANTEGVAVSATQRNTLLVVPNSVPIVESADALVETRPPVHFRRVFAVAAVADRDTTLNQFSWKDMKIKGRRTINEPLLAVKHPPVSTWMNGLDIAIAAVGFLLRCEGEDFVDLKDALIKADACNHMMVTVTVTLGHAYSRRPFYYTVDVWTLPLSRAATSPERRGTQRSSSSTCHNTPHCIRINRRSIKILLDDQPRRKSDPTLTTVAQQAIPILLSQAATHTLIRIYAAAARCSSSTLSHSRLLSH